MSKLDSANADIHLLFGVLAVQLNYITPAALLEGLKAWVRNKSQSLGEILASQGNLTAVRRALLDSLVAEYLESHQNNSAQCLASLPVGEAWQSILEPIDDPDVQASLSQVGQPIVASPYDTYVPPSVTENIPPPDTGPVNPFQTLVEPADQGQTPQGNANTDGNFQTFVEPLATKATSNSNTGPKRAIPSGSANRFKIVKLYAKGGLGEVYIAADGEIRREVALKHIQDRYADDDQSRQRFVAEAEITGSLEHPSIVPVYGLGQYPNGRPYYAMRFIRGDSLKEAIDKFHQKTAEGESYTNHRLELRHLLGQFVDVCNAMDYAHNRQVIHRDLKPANIMLGKYGETFVVDWGLAKPVDAEELPTSSVAARSATWEGPVSLMHSTQTHETRMGTQVGTPQFMSPEQAAGQLDQVRFASDIYSLGATLYYLIAGVAPFNDPDLRTLLKNVQEGVFPKPREVNRKVPKVLQAICLRAMALTPAQRHATARELADEIDCWLADEPVKSYEETPLERVLRWTRRHRAWTQAIIGSVFLVAIVATVSTILISRARTAEFKALGIAKQEKQASEASFQMARKTVDQFFTSVSETKLLNVPGLQPLRQELLRDALAYYEGFVDQRGNDPKLRAELAATFFRIGMITNEIGSKSDALRSLDKALTAQRELLTENPDSLEHHVALGETLNGLGDTTLAMGEYAKSLDYFTQAKEQRELAAKVQTDDPQLQRKVLNSYDNMAVAQSLLGNKQEAIQSYEQANLARAKLVEAHPDDPVFERDLAKGYFNLAQLQTEIADYEAAIETLRRAEEIYQRLVTQHNEVIDYARELAIVQRKAGDIEMQRGDLTAAGLAYQQAHQLGKSLARANPLVAELSHELVRLDIRRAQWFLAQSNLEAADADYSEALVLLKSLAAADQSTIQYVVDLAEICFFRGQLLTMQGKQEEARQMFAESVRLYETPTLQAIPKVNNDLPVARLELGIAWINLGIPDKAVPVLKTALEEFEQLATTSPALLNAQLMQVRARTQLGVALGASMQPDEGLQQLQTAVSNLELLRPKFPLSRELDLELSNVHARTAELQYSLGRIEDVVTSLGQVIALRKKIGESESATAGDVLSLAEAMQGLSFVLLDGGKNEEALTNAEKATEVLTNGLERFPEDERLLGFLGNLYLQRIEFETEAQRFTQICILAEQAVEKLHDPPVLIQMGSRLVAASTAAAEKPDSEELVSRLQQTAISACAKVAQKYPKVLNDLKTNPDFKPLQDVPQWKALLEGKKVLPKP